MTINMISFIIMAVMFFVGVPLAICATVIKDVKLYFSSNIVWGIIALALTAVDFYKGSLLWILWLFLFLAAIIVDIGLYLKIKKNANSIQKLKT